MKIGPDLTYEERLISEPHRVIFQDGKAHDYRKIFPASVIRDPADNTYITYIPFRFDVQNVFHLNTIRKSISIVDEDIQELKRNMVKTFQYKIDSAEAIWSQDIINAEEFTALIDVLPIIDRDLTKDVDHLGTPSEKEVDVVKKILDDSFVEAAKKRAETMDALSKTVDSALTKNPEPITITPHDIEQLMGIRK